MQQITELEQKCSTLEKELYNNYIEEKEHQLRAEQAELNNLLKHRVEYLMHMTRHKYYSDGSRPSRLLALTRKCQESRRSISAINCPKKGWLSTELTSQCYYNL